MFALAFVVAAWRYFKTGSKAAVVVCTLALAAPLVNLNTPRLRHVFYAFYPVHLAALWLLASRMK
ncbi:TraX family protein [Verminephrobacter eiseniae]|uniref:TraX family protein n=1 Tax=Verminephrobacter eiseniae TaxID=364317 RepID=UPI0022380769|nr:TraX family protein [Verminephrobacter eiseniae]MCW5239071.1 hypothetical protein [Verminephrobacter eiseniae]